MTELQKAEFEILKEFIRVCNQLNLKYYLVCGTALGAVKYQGFIPWDDDIDVALHRKDYEMFCKKAQSMMPAYYFLQNYRTDSEFPAIYCKIRDSRTTYIEQSAKRLNINHGIYIDVFPLDGYPNNSKEINILELKKRLYKLQLASAFNFNSKQKMKTKIFFFIERLLGIHKRSVKVAKHYEGMLSKWPIETSNILCNHGNWQGELEYAPKWHYGEGTWAEFEGLKVRIPENYDAYLTQKYGNWREDLPEEERVGHHYYEVCDVDKPYTAYIDAYLKRKR